MATIKMKLQWSTSNILGFLIDVKLAGICKLISSFNFDKDNNKGLFSVPHGTMFLDETKSS